jgi:hypothetical protein
MTLDIVIRVDVIFLHLLYIVAALPNIQHLSYVFAVEKIQHTNASTTTKPFLISLPLRRLWTVEGRAIAAAKGSGKFVLDGCIAWRSHNVLFLIPGVCCPSRFVFPSLLTHSSSVVVDALFALL